VEIDYATPIEEIRLRYVVTHSAIDLEKTLNEIFRDVASTSYNKEDITDIFHLQVINSRKNNDTKLTLLEIKVLNMPYSSIKEFEDRILDEHDIREICKTFDSCKLDENCQFLKELYETEMKIREIYTTIARMQHLNLKNSKVKLLKEYQENEASVKARLMNEFFFIEFSDYKNIDSRRDAKLEDLLDAMRDVRKIDDIGKIVTELSHPKLHLEELFNELSRVPEAIGRLESFRNCIAHNRFISENDVENFRRAKSIVDEIYNRFVSQLSAGEI